MLVVVKWIIWFLLFYIEACIWGSLLWWRGPAAGFLKPPLLYIAGPIGGAAGVLLFVFVEMHISKFSDDRKAKWKTGMWTVVISSLLLAIVYTSYIKVQIRQEILAHLHDRYGMEFEITEGEFDTFAYPKGQPEIKFKVFRQIDGAPRKYADWYLTEKWAYQARPFIERKLQQVYGEEADIRLASCYFNFGDKARDLDFEQAFEKYSRGIHEDFKVSYWVFMNGANFKQEEEVKKAFEVFKVFSCRKFHVTYIDINDKEDFLANSKQYYDNWHFKNTRGRSQRNQYEQDIEGKNLLAWLRVNDSLFEPVVVNNADDLIKYFGP